MFTIYGGKTEFEQWDLDQLVSNPCMKEGNEVVFKNSHGETYVTKAFKRGGEVLADVPNYLLQKHGNILVTLEQGADRHTECETIITVRAKDKPEDYKCSGNIKERKQDAVGGGGGNTIFYTSDGSTLYTDSNCTVAATAQEVFDACWNGRAFLTMPSQGMCTDISLHQWQDADGGVTDMTNVAGVIVYVLFGNKKIVIGTLESSK